MNGLNTILLLARYNFKILFGGRYLVFALLSLLFLCYLLFDAAFSGTALDESVVAQNMIMPSLLLIFYPATYGIQKDEETKILEIFFCIPNYMYKIWLLRLLFIFIACYFNIIVFSYLAHLLLCPVEIFTMANNAIFVVVLFGALAFWLSTIIKSGNGVAVVVIALFALLTYIGKEYFENTMWDIMLNPYSEPDDIHSEIWQDTLSDRLLLLSLSSIGLILLSLNNLRRREKLL